MIGAGRVISDRVTFGYLTDVYVVKEHQKRGLGTFLLECLAEILDGWPDLRRFWIMTSSPEAKRLYERIFGAVDFFSIGSKHDARLLQKNGPKWPADF